MIEKKYRLDNIGLLSTDNNWNLVLIEDSKKINKVDNRNNSILPISKPIYFDIHPSFNCNFRCIFCYNTFLGNWSNKTIMSKKTIKNIISYCDKNGVFWLNVLGGEPWHPKNIENTRFIIKEAYKHNIRVDVTTNGYYINKKTVDFCKKYDVRFNISLLALNKCTGSEITGIKNYNLICKIDKYLNNKINFGISTPIIKQNKNEIFELCNYINKLSNYSWVLRYPTLPDNNNINLSKSEFFTIAKKIIKKSNKNVYFDAPFAYKKFNIKPPKNKLDFLYCGCKAGYLKLEVLPNGDIVRCGLLRKTDGVIGNINYDWDNIKLSLKHRNKKINCNNKNCDYKSFCTGCPGYAILNNKLFDDRCLCYAKNKTDKRNCSK
ncbi:MAG: radical SAM protein [Acholeplasmataceae bacterium]|jgi:radical SAM protein with 4Fe4S-binding SPASM domain|nr:radical SAM protein [Acholeplasmataceae bacterium]